MKTTREILEETKAALPFLTASRERKNAALLAVADRLEREQEEILRANRLDVEGAKDRYGEVMMDRLTLTPARIAAMEQRLVALGDRIRGADPRGVLARGYALVTDARGVVVKSAGALPPGTVFKVMFADGTVEAVVKG